MSEPRVKPEWYPWDDDVSNDNGWYGRKEMDAYIEGLRKECDSLFAQNRQFQSEIFDNNCTIRNLNIKLSTQSQAAAGLIEALEEILNLKSYELDICGQIASKALEKWESK